MGEEKKKSKGGHPPKFKTSEDLANAINKYFDDCEERDRFPTVAGIQVALQLFSDNFFKEQARRGPEFSKIIKECRARMFDEKMQAAATGKMNPTIFIFDAINNHGMVNKRSDSKVDATVKSRKSVEELSDDELMKIAKGRAKK